MLSSVLLLLLPASVFSLLQSFRPQMGHIVHSNPPRITQIVFLPLTLIAGWYGMNFVYMPELKWVYGYPVAIGASILVIIVSLWIFKKKKYL